MPPCEPLKPIEKDLVPIDSELQFQYDKLRLLFNNDEKHDFVQGFKYCMDIVLHKLEKDALQKL